MQALTDPLQLEAVLMQAPAPMALSRGPDHRFVLVNEAYRTLVGNRPLEGRPVREAFPELEGQGFFELLDGVFRTGQAFKGKEVPARLDFTGDGRSEERFFDFIYHPVRGADGAVDGIMTLAHDVTDQVRARQKEEAISAVLRSRQAELALAAEVGAAFTGALSMREALDLCARAMVTHLGAAFARIWTLDESGTTLVLEASAGQYTHLDGAHARVPVGKFKIGHIAESGEPHLSNDVQNDPRVGDQAWARREGMISFAGYPLKVDGRVIGVMALFARRPLAAETLTALGSVADTVAVGVQRKRLEVRAREESESLEIINDLGQALAAELNLERLVQSITDSATRLAGAQFGAFFYNTVNDAGQAYVLYAISGVPREAFSSFPMPRNTKVFAPTFGGEGVVRVADIRKDPRYGQNAPYHGMPKGHLPVVSYLAVPVISRDGRVIGGLFFGHERAGVFTERAERLVSGLAAQAAVAMDNARLFREAQLLIAALERSNAELDQFAYVASHDLKAPLRGIANLSQWVEEDLGQNLPPQTQQHMELLRRRVHRMEALIEGILQFSRAGRIRGEVAEVDVGRLLQEAVDLMSPPAAVKIDIARPMPTLRTERVPLQQVFMNLISNALKHAGREDVRVQIRCEEDGEFWRFCVADNGPGIAAEFHERIWGLFQTLEARDKVESTGIGLAVVRKLVAAHGGRAWVESAPGEGASFHFTWPRKAEARA